MVASAETPAHGTRREAPIRFQTNSTTMAPRVAAMKPAPWSKAIPADGLADEARHEGAGDAEPGRQQ
jgi:hypothetical protein